MVPGLHNKTKQDYYALFSEPQTRSNVQSYITKLFLHLSGHIVGDLLCPQNPTGHQVSPETKEDSLKSTGFSTPFPFFFFILHNDKSHFIISSFFTPIPRQMPSPTHGFVFLLSRSWLVFRFSRPLLHDLVQATSSLEASTHSAPYKGRQNSQQSRETERQRGWGQRRNVQLSPSTMQISTGLLCLLLVVTAFTSQVLAHPGKSPPSFEGCQSFLNPDDRTFQRLSANSAI